MLLHIWGTFKLMCIMMASFSAIVSEWEKHRTNSLNDTLDYLTWIHGIVKISPLIHPDLGHPGRIVQDYLAHTTRECIRTFIPEHMSHMWARTDF